MSDWSKSVRRPPVYRVNGSMPLSQLNTFVIASTTVLLTCFFALLTALPNEHDCPTGHHSWPRELELTGTSSYNTTYPILGPADTTDGWGKHRFIVITDLDLQSKSEDKKNTWFSNAKFGTLKVKDDRVELKMEDSVSRLESTLSQGGRAMELSDLKVFDGHLISVDDRTGVLYRINIPEYGKVGTAVPWVILSDGAGNETKGFKGEWLSVKDGHLYVGGLGKEWTTIYGEYRNENPFWIKVVSPSASVKHIDWKRNYKTLRSSVGIEWPGYMIHESAQWSPVHQRWFFLPRRASKQIYTEANDETRGTNYMLVTDEHFTHVETHRIGEIVPARGYSAFQFIPGSSDGLIMALKSEEDKGRIRSYISVFDVKGNVILDDVQLDGEYKFEGIEFI